MKLYHGSYTAVEQPETTKGREKVDFGQGFYLTNIQSQAEKWSKVIAIRKGPKYQPVVSVFELDEDVFTCKDFRIKTFEKYDIEWLQYCGRMPKRQRTIRLLRPCGRRRCQRQRD